MELSRGSNALIGSFLEGNFLGQFSQGIIFRGAVFRGVGNLEGGQFPRGSNFPVPEIGNVSNNVTKSFNIETLTDALINQYMSVISTIIK